MKKFALATVVALLVDVAVADTPVFEGMLEGHLVINPHAYVTPPKDAPYSFSKSGRFTGKGNKRVESLGAIQNATGVPTPFAGQPLQGFSGIKNLGDIVKPPNFHHTNAPPLTIQVK